MTSIFKALIETLVQLIFKIISNSIGAALRWIFFLGRYSYSHLSEQSGRNITVFILTFIILLRSAIYLNENDKKEIKKQEKHINLSISNHE